jgi:hypothetical protein
MCNPFFYEFTVFRLVPSVSVFKLVCCSSDIYTSEAEDYRVDPHRPLDQPSKKRTARGHYWFYDGSLLVTARAGAADLQATFNPSFWYVVHAVF